MNSNDLLITIKYYKEIIKYYDKQIQTLKELVEYMEKNLKDKKK
jgi:hypothetical protein